MDDVHIFVVLVHDTGIQVGNPKVHAIEYRNIVRIRCDIRDYIVICQYHTRISLLNISEDLFFLAVIAVFLSHGVSLEEAKHVAADGDKEYEDYAYYVSLT